MKSLGALHVASYHGGRGVEDFRGNDCALVASWYRGKGLNKPCAISEGIQIFEYMNVLSCVYIETQYLYSDLLAIHYNNKMLNRGQYFDLPRVCFLTRGYARAYHELLQGQRYANESLAHS